MSLLFDAEAAAEQLRIADDAELLERSRRGDSVAFAELFRRYRPIALMVAARTSSALDPEDVSSEAFTRVWRALRNGGGPSESFRPYLSTSVRNVALNWRRGTQEVPLEPQVMAEIFESADDTEVAIAEAELIGRAFRALPQRWQDVLWATEVEGVGTAELAERLGTSNNATAALCLRAREGLRNAWLAEHIDRRAAEPECRWVLEHLSAFTRQRLPQAQHQRVADHLDQCRRCRMAASRLDRVVSVLRISVVAGGTSVGLLLANSLATGAGTATVAAASIRPSSWIARFAKALLQPQLGLAAVVGTVAVASLGIGAHLQLSATAASLEQALQPSMAAVLPAPNASAAPLVPPTPPAATDPGATLPTAANEPAAPGNPRPAASPSPSSGPQPAPEPSRAPTLTPSPSQAPSTEPSPSVQPTPSEPTPSEQPTPSEPTPSEQPTPSEPTPSEPTPTPSPMPTDSPSAVPTDSPSPTPTGPEPSASLAPSAEPSPSDTATAVITASAEPSPITTIGPTDSATPTESANPTVSATPSAPPSETATPQPSPTSSCVLIWDFFLRIGICRA